MNDKVILAFLVGVLLGKMNWPKRGARIPIIMSPERSPGYGHNVFKKPAVRPLPNLVPKPLKENKFSGYGSSGTPRFGRPKTDEERLETHRRLYGDENLPPRGTGLKRRGVI